MDNKFLRQVYFRMKTLLLTALLFFFIFSPDSVAQRSDNETPPLRERLFYGGNFGLQFGTYTDIQVSPVIGLWILPRLAVAAGPDYRYYKDPNNRTAIYGGSAYLQFVVIQDLNSVIPLGLHFGFFLHFEDELLSLKSSFWKYPPPYESDRFIINTPLAGAGISQPMGRRSSMNIMFLWAMNEPFPGIYSNPEIRVTLLF